MATNSKQTRGFASQFFVAGELSRRGAIAVITNGNCPNTDILCSNIEGTRFVHVQVKTFVPGRRTCSVGRRAETNFGDLFFWVLNGLPEYDSTDEHTYYIIPSPVMAANVQEAHQLWLDTPGKKGQEHNDNPMRTVALPPFKSLNGWDISEYKNRWELILNKFEA